MARAAEAVQAAIIFCVFYAHTDIIQELREQKWPEPTGRQHTKIIKRVAKFWHLVTTEYDSNSSYYFSPPSPSLKIKKRNTSFPIF